MTDHPQRTDRRALVKAALGAAGTSALSACTRKNDPAGSTTSSPTSSDRPGTPGGPTTPSPSTLATPRAWRPDENEVEPGCKVTAVRQVSAALTVDGTSRKSLPRALRPLAEHVEGAEQAVVEVIYPQYGGLSANRSKASVMVVLDLTSIAEGSATTSRTSMTLDVRLRKQDSWQVTEVLIPKARQEVTPTPDGVQQLMRNPRVELPREARLDLMSGQIDPKLVKVMTELAKNWRLGVHVLRSGHPKNVFDTDRLSNHSRGKAVDIWALDRIPVIQQDRAPWREAMEAAVDHGADEVGGPRELGGPTSPYFTDQVHQDHLHVAIEN